MVGPVLLSLVALWLCTAAAFAVIALRAPELDDDVDVDEDLELGEPIAGPGSEVYGFVSGWSYCGACGYTGRVLGPRQAACSQWIWHAHLDRLAEMELAYRWPAPARQGPRAGERPRPRLYGAERLTEASRADLEHLWRTPLA